MKLAAKIPWMFIDLNDFNQFAVGMGAGNLQTAGFKNVAVFVIKFISVSVPFGDAIGAVGLPGVRTGDQLAGMRSQPHSSPPWVCPRFG